MNISVRCPVCNGVQEHEILKDGEKPLVRCTVCRHTHRTSRETEKAIVVKTIVSAGEESRVCSTELDGTEVYRIGDSVVVECGDEVQSVEITGIEEGERRVERAKGIEIRTLWTRTTREVTVKISLHEGRSTTPMYFNTQGDDEFEVGREYVAGKRKFLISHIKLRNDRFLRREGERALAKDIKRIYSFRS
jgi:uncharacterized Zn finger protein